MILVERGRVLEQAATANVSTYRVTPPSHVGG
jgi:hypothetical protein